jgi:oxygen-independent coproporphyrinogen-3 oxidase
MILIVATGKVDNAQVKLFREFISEGLIIDDEDRYNLSIIGEVFMGHLVRSLKKIEDQKVIDEYIDEGYKLGTLLSEGKIPKNNQANNRQKAKHLMKTA